MISLGVYYCLMTYGVEVLTRALDLGRRVILLLLGSFVVSLVRSILPCRCHSMGRNGI